MRLRIRAVLGLFPLAWILACGDDAAGVGGSSSDGGNGSVTTTGADASTTTTADTSGAGGASTGDPDSSSSGAGPSSSSGPATESSGPATESSSEDGTTTGGAVLESDAFFAQDGIARIDLALDDVAIASLWDAPTTYVHADAQIELANGEVLELPDIGVRLKGVYGSFRNLDQKAAFLLRFDEFDPDQEPLGLEKVALNNMVQDPSMIHEQLAYALFRDAGVPAPRTSYARVFVNDELYGLYATVEATDNNVYLEGWFGNDDGNLYEGEYGSDFYPGWGPSFDLDNGTDVDFADIEALAAAFDAMNDPATFVEDADAVIDVARYLQFAATEIFIGHWDGYAWTRNNYFVYRGDDGRWTFMPWGLDQTFFDYLPIWGGDGRVQRMCGDSVPCRQQLAAAFVDVGQRVVDLGLVERCDALRELIDEAMQEDPRREYDAGTVYWAIGVAQDFLGSRAADIEGQFVCTDPTTVDDDGDLAHGCGYDCDDDDPEVYPGAPEQCNTRDDDCNGLLDDDPMCPQCIVAPLLGGDTVSYCFTPRTYDDAEADCVEQGGHLVSIHSQAEQDAIVDRAFGIQTTSWWIGFDDRAIEGSFAWIDGTPLDFAEWAGGEPNDSGGVEDCTHIADWGGGAWNDIGCDASLPYVCRLP